MILFFFAVSTGGLKVWQKFSAFDIMRKIFFGGKLMGKNITPTVEGGLLAAITLLVGLVSVYVPILGMFAEFFCAVPLAVLAARQGAGKALSALFVTFILLSILISPVLATRLALSFGLCGVMLGWCVSCWWLPPHKF